MSRQRPAAETVPRVVTLLAHGCLPPAIGAAFGVAEQGGIVWMALAMMIGMRLWLADERSEHRDLALIRCLLERIRRCAAHRLLLCRTDGLRAYVRAIRETCRDPEHTGAPRRPHLRPWRHICIAQVVKRYTQEHVVDVARRIGDTNSSGLSKPWR